MKIEWYLSCSKDEALKILQDQISGPMVPAFFGKNYHGFIAGNSFTIWNNHESFRNRTAIAKGKILETVSGVKLEARTLQVFPSRLAPSSPIFYWFAVPLTLILWVSTVLSTVFEDYGYLLKYFFPLTMVGIVSLLLGFMKWQGSGNIIFLEKFLHQTFSKYRKE